MSLASDMYDNVCHWLYCYQQSLSLDPLLPSSSAVCYLTNSYAGGGSKMSHSLMVDVDA